MRNGWTYSARKSLRAGQRQRRELHARLGRDAHQLGVHQADGGIALGPQHAEAAQAWDNFAQQFQLLAHHGQHEVGRSGDIPARPGQRCHQAQFDRGPDEVHHDGDGRRQRPQGKDRAGRVGDDHVRATGHDLGGHTRDRVGIGLLPHLHLEVAAFDPAASAHLAEEGAPARLRGWKGHWRDSAQECDSGGTRSLCRRSGEAFERHTGQCDGHRAPRRDARVSAAPGATPVHGAFQGAWPT